MAKKKLIVPNVNIKVGFDEMWERGLRDPVLFVQDFLDQNPHPGQAAWLRRSGKWGGNNFLAKPNAKQSVLSTGNRWGKTVVLGWELLWRAFYQIRPDKYKFDDVGRLKPYRCVNVSLSLDQAMIAWNYALSAAQNSPIFSEFIVDITSSPFPSLILGDRATGSDKIISEIWARSTAKGARFLLGKTFNFLSWDEAAFQPDGREILNNVIRMRLVDQAGDLVICSAPAGKNWLYEEFLLGVDEVRNGKLVGSMEHYSQQGCTFDNPRIDHASVHRSMELMSEDQRKQNIYGQFADVSAVFDTGSVLNCYQGQEYGSIMGSEGLRVDYWPDIEDVDGNVRGRVRQSDKPIRYCMGVDLGRKRDQTCIVVLALPENPASPAYIVYFHMTNAKWKDQYNRIEKVQEKYRGAPGLIDSTSMGGDAILEMLQSEPYSLDVSGYNLAGGQEKTNLILHLQAAIQEGRIKFPYIPDLVNQLVYYQWQDKNLKTDAVFALALAWEKALEMGMGEGSEVYKISSPDVGVICVSRDFLGKATISGIESCPVCMHPAVELVDTFCLNGIVNLNSGEVIDSLDRLITVLNGKYPDNILDEASVLRHKKSHVMDEYDEDDEFDMMMKNKFSKMVLL